MRVFFVVFATLIALSWTGLAVAQSAGFHVAADGNDAWSGTKATRAAAGDDGPFRTLTRARDAVRRLKRDADLPAAGVVIEIAPGTYTLDESFALTKEDSGTEASPVTYRASRGGVHVIGGKTVDGFRPVSDPAVRARLDAAARQSVLELHLPSVGVTDFGHIANSGFGRNVRLAHLEVFFDGLPMRLAEWPNGDWTSIASVPKGEQIVDSSGKPRGTRTDRFHYDGDRPKRWESFSDVWVHGYWFVDWADQYLKVKNIDVASRAVMIEPPQSGYGYKKHQRFRFLNIIEELDRPGEYYVDRKSGMLYLWPPEEATRNVATVSLLTEPLIVFRDASHVRMIGLMIEGGRSDGVVVQGGEGVLLAGCTIRNLGGAAVRINGGQNHRVQSCDLGHLGDGGILIEGGSRRTLTPAGHVADYKIGIHFDARGIGWSRRLIEGRRGSWDMFGRLASVPYDKPPYSTKYPQLPNILNEKPLEPKDNRIVCNIFEGEPWLEPRGFKLAEAEQRGWVRITSNLIGVDPRFLDREGGDFRLAEDSPAREIGFQEIHTEEIGLRLDEYRRELPGR